MNPFKRTCKSCFYYLHIAEQRKVNPDKTTKVTQSEYHVCINGDFILTDFKRCSEYYWRMKVPY